MVQSETSVERTDLLRVPFASKHLMPVAREEKDTTLRVEHYDLEASDEFVLVNEESNVEWAIGKVTQTFTCQASDVKKMLRILDAGHSLTESEKDVYEILQPYYGKPIEPDTVLQGIMWKLKESFVESHDTDDNQPAGEEERIKGQPRNTPSVIGTKRSQSGEMVFQTLKTRYLNSGNALEYLLGLVGIAVDREDAFDADHERARWVIAQWCQETEYIPDLSDYSTGQQIPKETVPPAFPRYKQTPVEDSVP
jgi:hypothetical protein